MPEHLTDIIPPGLKRRWEEFAEAVRASWKKVHEEGLKGGEAFERFWQLMRERAKAGVHLMSVAEAKRYRVKPHPFAVFAKMAKGLSREQAEKEAIEEGKFHGISLLRAEIEKAKEQSLLPAGSEAEAYEELTKELEAAGLP